MSNGSTLSGDAAQQPPIGAWVWPFEGLDRQAALVIATSWAGWLLVNMDAAMFTFTYPLIQRDLGLSLSAVSYIYTTMFVVAAVATLGMGPLIDRYGRRPLFNATMGFTALGSVLTSVSGAFWSICVCRAITQVGASGEITAGQVMLAEATPARTRGLWNGYAQTGWPAGWFVAAGLAAVVVPVLGWRGLFVIGVLPGLFVLFVRRFVREPVRPGSVVAAGSSVPPRPRAAATLRQTLAPDLRRTTITIFLWQFIYNYGIAAIIYWLPTIIQAHHLPLTNVYSASAIATACGGAGYVVAATLGNRYGRRGISIVWLLLGSGVGLLFWRYGTDWRSITVFYSLFYFFTIGHMGAAPGFAAESFPTRVRGTGMAVFGSGCWCGFVAAALSGPPLFGLIGVSGAVLVWACLSSLVAAIVVSTARPVTPGQELEAIAT